MDGNVQAVTAAEAARSAVAEAPQTMRQAAAQSRPAPVTQQQAPATQQDDDALQGVSLADASATIGSGRNLVADYVMGANNQLAAIRVIDPTTHQVIAASPPDSIARMQQEIAAYQSIASQSKLGG